MPVALLERIPLPSLQTYTLISCSLFTCAVYYAHQIVTDEGGGTVLPFLRGYFLGPLGLASIGIQESLPPEETVQDGASNKSTTVKAIEGEGYTTDLLNVLITETWCVWTMINMAYCCLILMGKVIQKLVFGKLRVIENQRLRDKFWNFIFYKFIFIFGVMNVQNMDEVICWSAWFTVLGFMHLFSQLCKDRFEYLSFSPTTPNWMHVKVLGLLTIIQISCGLLTAICVLVSFHAGANTFAFMVAECLILSLKTLHVLIRYVMHLYDLHHEGVWENRGIYVYYLEFMFEMTILAIDFMHHIHMLVWGNIFLSMASLVICMQLRFLFHEFQRRWKRHKNYLRVVNNMEARFPMANEEELNSNNDECAICWEKMETARKLECGHLFHNACLRSWLEQETSCPICRASLGEPPGDQNPMGMMANPEVVPIPPLPVVGNAPQPRIIRRPLNTTNHFFHFDASRYISWLPSFSVEVTHTQFNPLRTAQPTTGNLVQNSQLDNMVRQVQDVFPNMPADVILADLRLTRSVEITIENIIEERVVAPPTMNNGANQNANEDDAPNQEHEDAGAFENNSSPVVQPSTATNTPSGTQPNTVEPVAGAASLLPAGGGINLNLNFFTDDNIPGLSSSDEEEEEEETDSSGEDEHFTVGGRFSKSSIERESILTARKESLLAHARRKFLSRHGQSESQEIHEVDSADAENQSNSLLEVSNQTLRRRIGSHLESRNEVEGGGFDDEEVNGEDEEFNDYSEETLENNPELRRQLMLRAVQRRLHHQ